MAGKRGYERTGGGCLIHTPKKHPCDDVFEGKDKVIVVISTKNAHFTMPDRIRSPSQIKRKKGVKSVKVINKKTYYGGF